MLAFKNSLGGLLYAHQTKSMANHDSQATPTSYVLYGTKKPLNHGNDLTEGKEQLLTQLYHIFKDRASMSRSYPAALIRLVSRFPHMNEGCLMGQVSSYSDL